MMALCISGTCGLESFGGSQGYEKACKKRDVAYNEFYDILNKYSRLRDDNLREKIFTTIDRVIKIDECLEYAAPKAREEIREEKYKLLNSI